MSHYDGRLRNAANNGELARVRELLDLGANPNVPNRQGDTALLLAAHNGHAEVVRLLLAHHADPFIHRKGRITPLVAAIVMEHEQVVELLLASAIANSPEALREGLGWAIAGASPVLVRRLLVAGADPSGPSSTGHSALSVARVWQQDSVEPYRTRFAEIIAILEDHVTTSKTRLD